LPIILLNTKKTLSAVYQKSKNNRLISHLSVSTNAPKTSISNPAYKQYSTVLYYLIRHHNKQGANTLQLIEKPLPGTRVIARSLASRLLDADYFKAIKAAVLLKDFGRFF